MDKVIREGAARVGVDLAKRVIQVHAVDAAGRLLTNRGGPACLNTELRSISGVCWGMNSGAE